jgi:hypothetical protein
MDPDTTDLKYVRVEVPEMKQEEIAEDPKPEEKKEEEFRFIFESDSISIALFLFLK